MTHRGPFQPRTFCDSVIQGTVAGGCHRIGAGSRAPAEPPMGQAGNVCVWGKPTRGAGRDAPGMLLPVAPIPPCPCGAWWPSRPHL